MCSRTDFVNVRDESRNVRLRAYRAPIYLEGISRKFSFQKKKENQTVSLIRTVWCLSENQLGYRLET